MLDQSKGRMFLAGSRHHAETDTCRSLDGFGKQPPFGALHALKDETLAGGASCCQCIESDVRIVLLPVVGILQYRDSLGRAALIAPGEMQEVLLPAGASIELSNPYEAALVNFLQLRFSATAVNALMPAAVPFDINAHPDALLQLRLNTSDAGAPRICIGRFGGRSETVHRLTGPDKGVFVFVIQGAFETQYRLLEARDGLALWNTKEVEIEALSNEAILLLVTLPLEAQAYAQTQAAVFSPA